MQYSVRFISEFYSKFFTSFLPVVVAFLQYNNWFTFSEYEEPVTVRSTRPIHARELATVRIHCLLEI